MGDVYVSYKGTDIIALSDTDAKTIKTGGKYCEDDLTLIYIKPSGGSPTGTKNISISTNGTTTHDVAAYANAQITVNVSGSSPTGTKNISISTNGTTTYDVAAYANAQITVNVSGGSTRTATATAANTTYIEFAIANMGSWKMIEVLPDTGNATQTLNLLCASSAGARGVARYSGYLTREYLLESSVPSYDYGCIVISTGSIRVYRPGASNYFSVGEAYSINLYY